MKLTDRDKNPIIVASPLAVIEMIENTMNCEPDDEIKHQYYEMLNNLLKETYPKIHDKLTDEDIVKLSILTLGAGMYFAKESISTIHDIMEHEIKQAENGNSNLNPEMFIDVRDMVTQYSDNELTDKDFNILKNKPKLHLVH